MTGEIPTVALLPLNDRGTAGWDDKEWGLRNARNDGRVGTAECGAFSGAKIFTLFSYCNKNLCIFEFRVI